ncbi:MAG: site-specific DNA-methyltransferase [Candidatus Cloacimonadaceae bacterium]|nr:site-specific DNA-methyltransferase [Candidatus Cloacimonadaceae bacterium]
MNNLLIKSDNLTALKLLLSERNMAAKIDLVYIDPPFATGGNFTITNGRASTISNSKHGAVAYSDKLLGNDFLQFLRARFELLRDLLSPQGSIYVHIDYKIGHYVKILMDEVFGIAHFRNDISRIKCNPKNFKRIAYGNVKDMILFYSKSASPIWNEPKTKYTDQDIKVLFPKVDSAGRRYTTVPIHAPGETLNGNSNKQFKGLKPPQGRHWRTDVDTLDKWDREGLIEWSSNGNPRKKIFAEEQEGKRVQDVWEFKDPQYPDYPTEKNADMLDLIIKTSSNENSIVLDCFCGSGTTLVASQKNNRQWIGIDQSDMAIQATRKKLASMDLDLFCSTVNYEYVELDTFEIKALDDNSILTMDAANNLVNHNITTAVK